MSGGRERDEGRGGLARVTGVDGLSKGVGGGGERGRMVMRMVMMMMMMESGGERRENRVWG